MDDDDDDDDEEEEEEEGRLSSFTNTLKSLGLEQGTCTFMAHGN